MMNDMRTISTKETMVDMSDTKTVRDTKTMSKGEIAKAKHMQVRGRGVQMMDSLNDVGILVSFSCSS